MFRSILVLESEWDPNTIESISVWPFVSEFAKVNGLKAYHQVFTDKNSFRHWIAKFNESGTSKPKLLYIASHGKHGRISGLNNEINFNTIVEEVQKAGNIQYVHIGSCLVGNIKNLTALLEGAKAKHITFVSGYDEEVAWIDSMMFDLMLWQRIISKEDHDKGKHFHTIVQNLVCDEFRVLTQKLGFRFAYRLGERTYVYDGIV